MAVATNSRLYHSPRKIERGEILTGMTVEFDLGLSKMKGLVVEDRGQIGVNGRRLYRILFPKNNHGATRALDRAIELPQESLRVTRA
jgi:hypothetical protein